MKQLFKNVNAFALALILICGVVVTTQSAFSDQSVAKTSGYGFYTGPSIPGDGVFTNTWYDFNAPPAGYRSVCNSSLEACTYEAPSSSSAPIDNGVFDLEEL